MQQYIVNSGKHAMFVAGKMIPPGEGRHVDVPHVVVVDSELSNEDGNAIIKLVQELLAKSVKDIVHELPSVTGEALDLLQMEETAGKGRKGVLEAIDAERIDRANKKLDETSVLQREADLEAARKQLLTARVALENLPSDAAKAAREAAEAAVDEAQAKVTALEAPAA